MTNPFQPATRDAVPVKVALVGPSGSGKTYTALRLARGIAGEDGRVALIDTEHGSASLYADEFQFDTNLMQPPYEPSKFAGGILVAAQAGYTVLIIDGISPAWNGPGGVMEIVDQNTLGGNSWSGWAKGSPAHQQLVQAILSAPIHLICTMRSKTAWVLETDERGKQKPRKVGMEPVQRDGIDYEFSVVGELDLDHRLTVTKSRLRAVAVGEVIAAPSEQTGALLLEASKGGRPPLDAATSGGSPTAQPEPAEGDPAQHTLPVDEDTELDRRLINRGQQTRLFAIGRTELKLSDAQIRTVVHSLTGSESTSDIQRWQYDQVIADLRLAAEAVPS